jgi:hypothetical protein
MFLSTAWKNRLDGPCASLTQWAEEVMMGKKSFWLWIDDVQVEIEEVFGGTQKKTDEVRNAHKTICISMILSWDRGQEESPGIPTNRYGTKT